MKCYDKIKRREIERECKWNSYISAIWVRFEWEKCEDYRVIGIELDVRASEMGLMILKSLCISCKFFRL